MATITPFLPSRAKTRHFPSKAAGSARTEAYLQVYVARETRDRERSLGKGRVSARRGGRVQWSLFQHPHNVTPLMRAT